MRTIKFRGKRIDNGEWVYGSLDLTDNSAAISWDRTDNDGDSVPWFANVVPDTVGQFTGLRDENEKEIYEGDIIYGCFKYDRLSADGCVIPDNDCLCKGVVKFSENALQWILDIFWAEYHIRRWMDEEEESEIPLVHFGYESPEYPMDCLEVIGNIYDNPDLIKKQ